MNVCLEQAFVFKYATTQLGATHVPVALVTNLMQTTIRAMVSLYMYNWTHCIRCHY